jgi:hypothetical protein
VRRAVHRAGIASALEPDLHRLPGLAKGASTPADGSAIGVQAPGDILLLLSQGISITDVSVIHPVILNALPPRISDRRCGCRTTRPAEVDRLRESGAKPLRPLTLLLGDVRVAGPAGDKALACARR